MSDMDVTCLAASCKRQNTKQNVKEIKTKNYQIYFQHFLHTNN